jgi:hypothetical protein
MVGLFLDIHATNRAVEGFEHAYIYLTEIGELDNPCSQRAKAKTI